ncbi:glycoside hydrolase family 26 protein [Seramator thermalis]|jgi:mannan endo-1,4-beta-mannosidase|uniref:glycoside hydrolase family 26 protein n=1 Tax=Seramator thermalis TaxID=2496270 RepID=UPI00101D1E47|nr:glycosyl hydrolase [Seramator thermalis]
MKKYRFRIIIMMLSFICINGFSQQLEIKYNNQNNRLKTLTPETQNLLKNLKVISEKGFMFGHQDDPLYGIGWEGDDGRSDVKSVVGDYPAVMGFDLGRIELGSEKNIDNVSFEKIRQEIIRQYQRGGMITMSWHVNNPLTDGDSWDVKNEENAVASVLPGGQNHNKFLRWLQSAADFFNSLKTEDGTKIPIVFRPWHEHTGSWFWWGKDLCATEEYKQLWKMTVEFFRGKGVNNLLYAYSPDIQGPGQIYMERYPGDEYVDILGLDGYHRDNEAGIESFQNSLNTILSFMTDEGKKRNKPIALTETGLEAIPIANWWTGVLLPIVDKYPISYVMVWRNARERENHYYAPYPGQKSAADFIKFYHSPKTLFCKDIPNLYK